MSFVIAYKSKILMNHLMKKISRRLNLMLWKKLSSKD